MNKRFLVFAAAALLAASVSAVQARAQDAPAAPAGSAASSPARSHSGPGDAMSPDRQVERLSRQLTLTEAQKTKITPIFADRQKQMEAIRADSSLTPEQRHSKMRAAFDDSNAKIRAELTDEQKTKFDEMQHGGMMHKGGMAPGGGMAPNSSAPPPNNR